MNSAKLIEIIETTACKGDGIAPHSPLRECTQYWSKDGRLLAENDIRRYEAIEQAEFLREIFASPSTIPKDSLKEAIEIVLDYLK